VGLQKGFLMKHTSLPEGMALVETADGRRFAAYISLVEQPPSGYLCREEALAACHAWYEEAELTQEQRKLGARTELYPERNVWYLEEIMRLTGGDAPRLHCGLSIQAMVQARGKDGLESITATGATPDEAIEALYQHVYEWSRILQDEVCSPTSMG
jgi:hypothetical protein